jgi:dihydroneopterin aldolase
MQVDGGTKMNSLETTNYETILNTVRQWPPNRRFALVQDVLNTLVSEVAPPRPRRKTLEKALGLLATDQPAPSDAEIKQWLNEHRMEKYG